MNFLRNLTRNQKIAGGAVLAVLVVLGTAVAVTAGGDDKEVVAGTTTTAAPTTTTAAPRAPLTFRPEPDAAKRNRPALVVKIDNDNQKARPQVGLNQADIVFEEVVEGGATRFAAVFHSTDSDPVGPVRSARTSDLEIVGNLERPLFAWSGANVEVASRVRNGPIVDLGWDAVPPEYFKERGRPAPSNLFTNTSKLFGRAGEGAQPPPQLFAYRLTDAGIPASAKDASHVRLNYGGKINLIVDWRWDESLNGWKRDQAGTPHVDGAGKPVAPQNVVIRFTQYRDSGFSDVTGAASPEAVFAGQGEVWVLTGGKIITGTWSQATPEAVPTYTDATGQPIKLAPGRTWVLLPRSGAADVVQ